MMASMRHSGPQRATPRRSEPDPYLVSTTEAARVVGQSPAAFRNRWDPAADGWIFRIHGQEVVVPNVPDGTRRRVPLRTLQDILHPQAITREQAS